MRRVLTRRIPVKLHGNRKLTGLEAVIVVLRQLSAQGNLAASRLYDHYRGYGSIDDDEPIVMPGILILSEPCMDEEEWYERYAVPALERNAARKASPDAFDLPCETPENDG